jgi:branched-chain amino acid transport system substrate-binding protein
VPLSGIRASFGASTDHKIEAINAPLANGIEIIGKTYAVEIIVKDNQSNPTRSLQVGNELILNDQPDIILVSDAEGGTAIANIADARGIPQISTGGPLAGLGLSAKLQSGKGLSLYLPLLLGRRRTRRRLCQDVGHAADQQEGRHALCRQ